MATRPAASRHQAKPRIRILCGEDIALGPGKVELLRAIAATGSLAAVARQLEMSYMRAWNLVQTMNACFRHPLVELERGGAAQGGATLSPTGERALELYSALERKSLAAMRADWQSLRRLLS